MIQKANPEIASILVEPRQSFHFAGSIRNRRTQLPNKTPKLILNSLIGMYFLLKYKIIVEKESFPTRNEM